MKRFVWKCLLSFAVASFAWHTFEYLWDRHLFTDPADSFSYRNVLSDEAGDLIREEEGRLQIVDTRPERSFRAGHIPGAVNVKFARGKFSGEAFSQLDPEKPALVYCDGGFRSRLALNALRDAGFEEVYHLHRGLLAWKFRGRRVEEQP